MATFAFRGQHKISNIILIKKLKYALLEIVFCVKFNIKAAGGASLATVTLSNSIYISG